MCVNEWNQRNSEKWIFYTRWVLLVHNSVEYLFIWTLRDHHCASCCNYWSCNLMFTERWAYFLIQGVPRLLLYMYDKQALTDIACHKFIIFISCLTDRHTACRWLSTTHSTGLFTQQDLIHWGGGESGRGFRRTRLT